MKKGLKRILSMALAFVLIFGGIFTFSPSTAMAAYAPAFVDSNVHVIAQDGDFFNHHYALFSIYNCHKASDITAVKSSNTSVARVEVERGYLRVYYYKPGTSTISCKVRGKKISSKITVHKYQNPFKSFKIGKTDFKSKFNKHGRYTLYHTKSMKNQDLSIQLNSGWIITSISSTIDSKHISESFYATANKTKYSLKKRTFNSSSDYITLNCYNKKYDAYQSIHFDLVKE